MSKRILQFDGLRAVAFFAVLLHHIGFAELGWTGVDIFFVLSGFLITSILRRERTQSSAIRHFYGRRVRRIIPPYLICLAFCAIFTHVDWRHVWIFYALPLENFASLRHLDLIGSLGPLWSLAIEEQFYLVWPLLVLNLPRKALLYVLGAIIVLSPIARLVATPYTANFWTCYLSTWFRLDTISLGALLALLSEQADLYATLRRCAQPVFWCGALAIGVATYFGYTLHSNRALFNGFGYTVVAFTSAGLVLWATAKTGLLFRILTFAPLRYVGTISYMAYLIHMPMLEAVTRLTERIGHPHHARDALTLACIFLFASATWFLIERPILRWNTAGSAPPADLILATAGARPASTPDANVPQPGR